MKFRSAPAQGAQLAEPQAGERGDDVERGVLVVGGVRGEQQRLGGLEDVEVVGDALRLALDVGERVAR